MMSIFDVIEDRDRAMNGGENVQNSMAEFKCSANSSFEWIHKTKVINKYYEIPRNPIEL